MVARNALKIIRINNKQNQRNKAIQAHFSISASLFRFNSVLLHDGFVLDDKPEQ